MAEKKTPARKKTRATKSTKPAVPSLARPPKPLFGMWTWITVLALAGLIGFTVYLNRRPPAPEAEATEVTTVNYVFTSEDGLPSSIEIKPAEGEAVRVARNAENIWALELPEIAEADQGSAEAAATSVTTLRILNEIDGALDVFGLDEPVYVITVKFTGGIEHVLEVGDTTPTNNGYYVRLDKEKMLIVSLDGVDSLVNLVSFPPYLNTPTPSPLPPTETPIPTAANAPEITVTPTP